MQINNIKASDTTSKNLTMKTVTVGYTITRDCYAEIEVPAHYDWDDVERVLRGEDDEYPYPVYEATSSRFGPVKDVYHFYSDDYDMEEWLTLDSCKEE